MVALTVALRVAPTASPFYEGVSPVSGANPYAWRRAYAFAPPAEV